MRFIATSDWQLGKAATFLDEEARPRYQQDRFGVVTKIAELAEQHQADFVVVCGDIFESNQLHRKVINRMFEALAGSSIPFILVPGNHDPLDSLSIYSSPDFKMGQPANVHVLRDDRPYSVSDGVEVVGAPWFSKRPLADLVDDACTKLNPTPAGVIRVLAGHGAVSSLSPNRDDPAVIQLDKLEAALADNKIQIAVLGDRHGTMKVSPRIWYSGTPEVTDRREIDPGNVLLVDIQADAEVHVEKIPVGKWKFLVFERRLDSCADVEAFLQELRAVEDKSETAIWLALSGGLGPQDFAALEEGLGLLGDLFAHLEHWDRHNDLVLIPNEADYSDLGLSGYASEAVTELVSVAAGTNEQAHTARGALALLYRMAGGNR